MSDQPPRLDLLQFLRRVQEQQLAQTDRWIAEEEQRLRREEARREPLPPPEWELQLDLSGRPMQVHCDGCRMGGGAARTRPLTRDQALRHVAVDGVPACEFCRPDSRLGVLE